MLEKLLVRRAKEGDKWALRVLYERYVGELFGWLWKKTGSRIEAEDVTSEVWVAVVEGLGEFGERSKFKNWLFGIARYKLMDFYREKYSKESLPLFEELVGQENVDLEGDDNGGRAKRKVEEVLAKLGKREKQILSLRFLRGYSVREVAEELGMSEGAVKTAQSRALKKARKHG